MSIVQVAMLIRVLFVFAMLVLMVVAGACMARRRKAQSSSGAAADCDAEDRIQLADVRSGMTSPWSFSATTGKGENKWTSYSSA